MSQTIDAIYEDGAFHPQEPVNFANGERVSLTVRSTGEVTDVADVADLLDIDYMESCQPEPQGVPSLQSVRESLAAYEGSLANLICEERDER